MADPAELDRLELELQTPAAREDTQRYLAGTEHTAQQLSRYLKKKRYNPEVVRSTVSWAREYGIVDDGRYAEIYVRSHSRTSPMGNYRLRRELRKRGVASDIVSRVLEERQEDDLFETLVRDVAGKYGGLEHEKARRRAFGYLQRRGFQHHLIMEVLMKALSGAGDEGP